MKFIVKKIFSLVILLQGIGIAFPSISFANDLTDYEEKGILTEIHNKCLDLWCEGGFKINFHTFDCSIKKGKCSFEFEYIKWSNVKGSFKAKCLISASSVKDLFENDETFTMSDHLYDQISNCVDSKSPKALKYYEKKK